jgi:colicin import membrane protein
MRSTQGTRNAGSVLGWLLLLVASGVCAQSEPGARERIETERATVEATFAKQERECQARFAVTACVEEAQRTRRHALNDLRRRAASLDEAQRRQRAERRRQAIADNLARDEAAQREHSQRAVAEPRTLPVTRVPPVPREARKPGRTVAPRASEARTPIVPSAAEQAAQRAQETQKRSDYEARERAAQAHRLEVERRNAERARRHKAAAPLPIPASAPR